MKSAQNIMTDWGLFFTSPIYHIDERQQGVTRHNVGIDLCTRKLVKRSVQKIRLVQNVTHLEANRQCTTRKLEILTEGGVPTNGSFVERPLRIACIEQGVYVRLKLHTVR